MINPSYPKELGFIIYLSTFPPRECGIATFTKDLVSAMNKKFNPALRSKVIALNNEPTDIYNYPKEVLSQITASRLEDYIIAARKINADDSIKLIHIQHEFGIFGGEWGNHLIPFLQTVEKPVIISFHAVLPPLNKHLEDTVRFLLQKSAAVIVMNRFSKEILERNYQGDSSKIFVIPHGIPQTTWQSPEKEKKKLGLKGKIVLSTFGLLSRGKGIEYVIRALPGITQKFPQIIYLILGVTHPLVRKQEGESYRNFLKEEVNRLGLKNYVKFYNKYLSPQEIISYLKATDIYLSPSLDLNQSVSGTLSYALGCGRPTIATASSYAKSIISPKMGILVKPKDSPAIQKALFYLLRNPEKRTRMGEIAYAQTRQMIWPNVALAHFNLYQKYVNLSETELSEKEKKLPPLTLKHLKRLTDNFGIIQFAINVKPDRRYGYSLDDNARAAIVAAKHWDYTRDRKTLKLLKIYLDFIKASQKADGSFASSADSRQKFNENDLSEDSQGRAIWALGYLISQKSLPFKLKNQAFSLFKNFLPYFKKINSPRARAFLINGLYFYNQAYPSSSLGKKLLRQLAQKQLNLFLKTASQEWRWFENCLTYSNSKLPESLIFASLALREKKYLKIAEEALNFLIDISFRKDIFMPIGQNGWYFKNNKRAYFDQQPEEVSSMVETLTLAYQTTKNPFYRKRAFQAFQWFLGENHLKQMVYNETSGGCHDGIGRYALNLNQGAESTISYLLARLTLESIIDK